MPYVVQKIWYRHTSKYGISSLIYVVKIEYFDLFNVGIMASFIFLVSARTARWRIRVRVCVYMYIYVYTHIYIYIFTYIYMSSNKCLLFRAIWRPSSGAVTSLFESPGLLNYFLPFNSVLDAFGSINDFHRF